MATTLIAISTSFSSEEEVLTKFDSSNDKISNWQIVDDGVMGGLSKGKFKISDKNYLIFNGNLSLKNNGAENKETEESQSTAKLPTEKKDSSTATEIKQPEISIPDEPEETEEEKSVAGQ